MSAKNRDEHNRWRNITVGFRVSPEENKQLNEAVALSGLPSRNTATGAVCSGILWCSPIRGYIRR